MGYSALVIILSIALLLAMITCMAVRPDSTKNLIVICMVIASLAGILLYAIGYGNTARNVSEVILTVPRVVVASMFMFVGRDGYSNVMANWVYFSEHIWIQIVFWFTHVLATYVAATTVLVVVGQRFVRSLRKISQRFAGNLLIVYGTGDAAYSFAEDLYNTKSFKSHILFIGDITNEFEKMADKIGAVAISADATDNEKWFVRAGLLKNKPVNVVCINESDTQTITFILRLIKLCQKKEADVSDLKVTIICEKESNFDFLYEDNSLKLPCALTNKYECPEINVYSKAQLSARKLMKIAPVYGQLDFEKGIVKSNDDKQREIGVIIIGFGDVGEAVLKSFMRNAHFEGCSLKIKVIEKSGTNCGGFFRQMYDYAIKANNIEFINCDTGSDMFAAVVNEMTSSLLYIVTCAGDSIVNKKIEYDIQTYIKFCSSKLSNNIVIANCDKETVGVHFFNKTDDGRLVEKVSDTENTVFIKVLDPEDIIDDKIDFIAKAINSNYHRLTAERLYPAPDDKNEYDKFKTARNAYLSGKWYEASFSDKESSRAMADFATAYIKIAGDGYTWNKLYDVLISHSTDSDYIKEILSRTEHLRWMGFEQSIGVCPKSDDDYDCDICKAYSIYAEIAPELEETVASLLNAAKLSDNEKTEIINNAVSKADEFLAAANHARKSINKSSSFGEHILLCDWESLDEKWNKYKEIDFRIKMVKYYVELVKYLLDNKSVATKPQKPVDDEAYETTFKMLDTNNIIGFAKIMMDSSNALP